MNYFPHTEKEVKEMLSFIGLSSIDELFSDIPCDAICASELKLPDSLSEMELKRFCEDLARRNTRYRSSFLGGGSYRHFIPAVVRAITSRPEFYTAYTPYQPEASQGTLQAIYEFQSFMCLLTGMDVSNASLYDGSTAVGEAAILAVNETRKKKLLVSRGLHPEYRQVLKTYLASSAQIEEIPLQNGITDCDALEKMLDDDTALVMIQNPNFFGCIEDGKKIHEAVKSRRALFGVAVVEPVSLGILQSPGAYGADIVVGECQSFGLPVAFGGPYLGFMATLGKYKRKIPGRLCGKTVDKEGKDGFVLTLQAREQHIRREKASSNICTNEALCALAATVYLSLMGKKGLKELAMQNIRKAHYAIEEICKIAGFSRKFSSPVFNECVLQCEGEPVKVLEKLESEGIAGGIALGQFYPELKDCLLLCVTEMNCREDIDSLVKALDSVMSRSIQS